MRRDHLDLHLHHEHSNWWFTARQRILVEQISRYAGMNRGVAPVGSAPSHDHRGMQKLLDIGCGGGAFVAALGQFGHARGMDADPAAVAHARARGLDVIRGRFPEDSPFDGAQFDLVTLLDVLEHIDDDNRAIEEIRNLVAPGGYVVCTVPAYRFLWSYHDVVNEHKRRYNRRALKKLLQRSGFRILKVSYFNTVLFPPIAAIRLLRRIRGHQHRADSPVVPDSVNALLAAVFSIERFVLRWGSLPFGVSILAIARKEPTRLTQRANLQSNEA